MIPFTNGVRTKPLRPTKTIKTDCRTVPLGNKTNYISLKSQLFLPHGEMENGEQIETFTELTQMFLLKKDLSHLSVSYSISQASQQSNIYNFNSQRFSSNAFNTK